MNENQEIKGLTWPIAMMIVYKGQPPICRAMAIWTLFMITMLASNSSSGPNGLTLGVLGAVCVASVTIHVHYNGTLTCRKRKLLIDRESPRHAPHRFSVR